MKLQYLLASGLLLALAVEAMVFPNDLVGEFYAYDAHNPAHCPASVEQTTYYRGPRADSWTFEHSTVLHDHARCDSLNGDRKTFFYNSKMVKQSNLPHLATLINSNGVNMQIDYPLNYSCETHGDSYFIGYEEEGRYCQDGSKFNPETVYFLFRPWIPVNMPIVDKLFVFEPEWKYLIVVPQFSSEVCVYKAFVPGAASDPAVIESMEDDEMSEMSPEPYE